MGKFIVVEGESRNSIAAEGKIWFPIKIVWEGRWDINWSKNPLIMLPQPNPTNLFFTLRVIYIFVIQNSDDVF